MWLPCAGLCGAHSFPIAPGGVEIAHAHVVRVEKNGALVLEDGRAVMLEGIRLADGSDRQLADQRADGAARPGAGGTGHLHRDAAQGRPL